MIVSNTLPASPLTEVVLLTTNDLDPTMPTVFPIVIATLRLGWVFHGRYGKNDETKPISPVLPALRRIMVLMGWMFLSANDVTYAWG